MFKIGNILSDMFFNVKETLDGSPKSPVRFTSSAAPLYSYPRSKSFDTVAYIYEAVCVVESNMDSS